MDEESNQSKQQQLLASSNSNTSSSFLYKQIKHSFWVFWTVVGVFLIISIFLSINTIIHVDYVKDEEPELTPVGSTHPTASPNSPMPLWLLVATLGCAAGAIAIAKRRKILSVLPSPQNQPPESPVQLSTEQISSPQENQQIYSVEESKEVESEDLLAEEKTPSILEDQLLIVVQELEVEDANAETESLAEMLDIRKKLPLSAILGESYKQLEAENE